MTGNPLRRLQELAIGQCENARLYSRATKEANLAGGQSEYYCEWKLRTQVLALESRHGQGSCGDRLPNQPSHKTHV
jgi:hypothetical protein